MNLFSIVLSGILGFGIITAIAPVPTFAEPSPSTYENGVDALTYELWWQIHPEMRDFKIDRKNSSFMQEWQAIRQVVRSNSTSFSGGRCFDGYSASFNGNLDKVADEMFYFRYPSFRGQEIRKDENDEIRSSKAWSEIRLRLQNPNGVTSC